VRAFVEFVELPVRAGTPLHDAEVGVARVLVFGDAVAVDDDDRGVVVTHVDADGLLAADDRVLLRVDGLYDARPGTGRG